MDGGGAEKWRRAERELTRRRGDAERQEREQGGRSVRWARC